MISTPHSRSAVDALRPLALLATGSTGADIERVIREARGTARRQKRPLVWADIETALTASARPPHDALDWQIAVHEIGHAVAYTALGIGSVSTIRIGGLGGEVTAAVELSAVQDETGLMKLIAAILAGRVAERIVLGKVHVGAGGNAESDLARATQLAAEAETSLGLGVQMPLLYRPPSHLSETLNHNPTLAQRVSDRLDTAAQIAQEVLKRHRDIITVLAERLKRERVMEGRDVVVAITEAGDPQLASGTAIPKSD